jgi:hypothetical protein
MSRKSLLAFVQMEPRGPGRNEFLETASPCAPGSDRATMG